MTKEEKALLDTLSYTEGTLGVSNNGYDVLFGLNRIIAGWTKDTTIVHGGGDWTVKAKGKNTNAAGRYQFMYDTWLGGTSVKPGPNLPMTKDNQDKRGLELLNHRLGNIDKTQLINQTVFNQALNKLAPEWASIPMTSDVITTDKYGVRTLRKTGFSYYDGDGLNKAKLTAQEIYDIYKLALSKYI